MSRKIPLVCSAPLHFLPDVRAELGKDFSLTATFLRPKAAVVKALRGARALITDPGAPYRVDRAALAAAPALEIVVTPSTGSDHIDRDYCRERNIRVVSLRGHESVIQAIHASAEFSFALLLALIRRLPAAARAASRGIWREAEDRFRGIELSGRRVSLIGYGRIGKKMSRYLNAFGARVTAYDPGVRVTDPWVAQAGSLREALRSAEIVCVHVHLDPGTEGMFGPRQFAWMPKGCWFLNTSRGGLVDEAALLAALRSGRLAGAAVDVIRGEQGDGPSRSPLVRHSRRHDNLIVTPHIAGLTVDSQRKAARFAAAQLRAHFGLVSREKS